MRTLMTGALVVVAGAVVPPATSLAQDVLVQPDVVFSTMGDQPEFPVANVTNQLGLSANYVSGVTECEPFVTNTTHADALGNWNSAPSLWMGVQRFDLGTVYDIHELVLWQNSNSQGQAIKQATLRGALDASMTVGVTSVGSFDDIEESFPGAVSLTFPEPVTARFVEWTIVNYGNGNGTRAAEVAFCVTATAWDDIGCATEGASGTLTLSGTGTLEPGSSGSLSLSQAPSSAPVLMLASLSLGSTPAFGGVVKPVGPGIAFVFLTTNVAGELSVEFASFPPLPPGTDVVVQCLIEDATAASGVVLSNALMGSVP